MDTLFQLLPREYNPGYDIQPYVITENVIPCFIISSFVLLFLLAIVKMAENSAISELAIPFLQSEQNSFQSFETEKFNSFTYQTVVLFSSLQLAFWIGEHMPVADFFTQYIVSDAFNLLLNTVFIFLFFQVKFLLFHSLSLIIPWNINTSYFIYVYKFLLLFFSIPFFMINCLTIFQFHKGVIVAFLILFSMFYLLLFVKWLFVSIRFKLLNSIYFFLYICTLEIVPLVIVIKLII